MEFKDTMKAILTGMNGTVAPCAGAPVTVWKASMWSRGIANKIAIEDPAAVRSFIEQQKPDWVCHMAMGSPVWAATMAKVCRENGMKFLFTGTCSVFDGSKPGPFPVDKKPDATDDYGRYKADCERQIVACKPGCVHRQAGLADRRCAGIKQHDRFLLPHGQREGRVEVSNGVIHSNAFLVDTADALYRLLAHHAPDLYQLEGNPGLTLYEIATRLNTLHRFDFPIVPLDEPRRDIRMIDDKITVGQLTDRLPGGVSP
jgi:dTDP-4-dehydrorhamnose reductase